MGAITVTTWIASSWVGVVAGRQVPPEWGLNFAVPVVFIAAVAPMIRGRANIAAAVVASVMALILDGLPYGLGLMVASGAGIGAGMVTLHLARGRA